MAREVRTVAVCGTHHDRSEDYRDYRHVARTMTVLVRDQQTGEYNEPHTHEHGQVLYASSGVMRVAAQNGLWFLPPRRALWIPAGVVHVQLMLSPVKLRSIYIDPEASRAFGGECKVLEVSVMLRELILALADQPVEYPQDSRNGHIVGLILSELGLSRSLPLQIPWPADRRLAGICDAILARPENPQSIDYWADKVGASSRTLIRLFLKETGLTFRHWVQQVRLATALNRLEQGQAIGVIANDLGYASPSAFSAMFRRVMGQSPREFLIRG